MTAGSTPPHASRDDEAQPEEALCRICARRPAVSREHIPQKASADYKKEVEIIFVDSTTKSGEMCFRSETSLDGFWIPSLCEKCNSTTGYRYGPAYKDFISQIRAAPGFVDPRGRFLVHLKVIRPARIAKQMLSMFLAAQPFVPADKWNEIREFVRKRDSTLPEVAPSIFIYRNVSSMGRVVPCCGVVELRTGVKVCICEVSWPPLGIIFSFGAHTRLAAMADVSDWGTQAFGAVQNVVLALPQLEVSTHYPLVYGSIGQVKQDELARLPVYLFHVPSGSESKTDISVVWSEDEIRSHE